MLKGLVRKGDKQDMELGRVSKGINQGTEETRVQAQGTGAGTRGRGRHKEQGYSQGAGASTRGRD